MPKPEPVVMPKVEVKQARLDNIQKQIQKNRQEEAPQYPANIQSPRGNEQSYGQEEQNNSYMQGSEGPDAFSGERNPMSARNGFRDQYLKRDSSTKNTAVKLRNNRFAEDDASNQQQSSSAKMKLQQKLKGRR